MKTLSLAGLPEGSEGEIIKVICKERMARRLADRGFTPGQKIKVLQLVFGGSMIVNIRGSKMALDKETAMEIIIERTDEQK